MMQSSVNLSQWQVTDGLVSSIGQTMSSFPERSNAHTHAHTHLKVRKPKITQRRHQQVNHLLPQVYAHCSLTAVFHLQRGSQEVATVTFTNCQLLSCDGDFEMHDMDAGIIPLLLHSEMWATSKVITVSVLHRFQE